MSALPPYAGLLGLTVEEDGDGPEVVMPYADALLGRPRFLHGGAIAGLLEIAALVALRRALGDEPGAKPIGVTVDFLRGGGAAETRARGEVVRMGARIANLAATAWQDDPARPIAAARMTVSLRRPG